MMPKEVETAPWHKYRDTTYTLGMQSRVLIVLVVSHSTNNNQIYVSKYVHSVEWRLSINQNGAYTDDKLFLQ